MAFVPTFENDVFISYATVDDEPIIDDDANTRWVSSLVSSLRKRIDSKLGRKGAVKIWMDRRGLQGNSALSPEIEAAVKKSAVLVCIATEGYLKSDWCRRERELFLEGCGGDTDRRIIVVRRDDIPHTDERWPKPFQKMLGYPFFTIDPQTGFALPYAFPKPDPKEKDYFIQVERVRSDIAQQLKKMTETAGDEVHVKTTGGQAKTNGSRTGQVRKVYLGEVTPDMHDARERVKRHLEQIGIDVRPPGLHSRVPEEFRAAVKEEMADCRGCVQLLGPYGSPPMPGLPHGYGGIEYEVAQAAGIPIVRWRDRDLDPDTITDPNHRAVVGAPDVVAMTVEELKANLEERIRIATARETIRKDAGAGANASREDSSGADCFVLLRSDPHDITLADSVAHLFNEHHVFYDIIDEDIDLRDVTESDDYDGLVVLYGNSPQDWVQDRIRECRTVALSKKDRAPVCAVYVGPPDPKDPLRTRPPRFHIIDDKHKEMLEQYIEELISHRKSA